MSLEVGQVFAGYTILRVLGAGGMGRVYLAAHPRWPREDALKVLPSELTDDAEYRARFEREAELAAGLNHPHIVGIHDRGEYDGQLWISMEYVAGTDVARLLREQFPGGMPVDEAISIIAAVGSALDYAHHRGLLHRDVKPANILLTDPDGGQARRVFLADFGIARRIDDAARLNVTNMAVGTAAYAASEQLMGESVDGRADQYALACTAFHLLAGAAPYGGSNLAVVIGQHVSAPPPSLGAFRSELAGLDRARSNLARKLPLGTATEFWQVFTLQPHPDGTLAGEYTTTASTACADRRTVTLTRTGDVDVTSLPDPVGQPPRVVSPAEALRGQYHVVRTLETSDPQQQKRQSDVTVRTNCLRTGERCMSYFHGPDMTYHWCLVAGIGSWTSKATPRARHHENLRI